MGVPCPLYIPPMCNVRPCTFLALVMSILYIPLTCSVCPVLYIPLACNVRPVHSSHMLIIKLAFCTSVL